MNGSDDRVPLPSRLDVSELAWQSVHRASSALSRDEHPVLSTARIAAAYRSDRHLLIDGAAPDVWSPLSRFWRTADGWVRTHGNYAHHAAALRAAFAVPPHSPVEDLERLFRSLRTREVVGRAQTTGAICVAVRPEAPDHDALLRRRPLVEVMRVGESPAQPLPSPEHRLPLRGVRVLDLTRVIAGPVATRTLALAGADVLRIDPPHLPEFTWQHLDTGHGKRSALLDALTHSRQCEKLLAEADVVVLGYRASGLGRLGLSPDALTSRHPHLVVAQLTAWGGAESERGFDSIVQAASGIAWVESPDGGRTPGALPAQALDHSAGYLLAAAITEALHRRARDGGAWQVRTSLRRVAAELLGMPRRADPDAVGAPPSSPDVQTFEVAGHQLQTVAPAVTWPGGPTEYASPRAWGSDEPKW